MDKCALAYIEKLYAVETPAMTDTRARIKAQDFSVHISPYEGRLLQTLIHLGNIKNCVEIGALGGYSALWLSDALKITGGHLYTCEHDEKRLKMVQETLSAIDNVTILAGDAAETLPAFSKQHGSVDMVFIDADKKSYLTYLDWAEKNVRSGGLIVADDTLLKGSVYMEELPYRVRQSTCDTLKTFNKRLSNPARYTSILLPTDAGLTIAVKK